MQDNPLSFFTQALAQDPEVEKALIGEWRRQEETIDLIASENYASPAVLAAQGSWLTNKYAEGYPRRRYYGGCIWVDEIEEMAISRAKALFDAPFANVQPHSGSQANAAVYLSVLSPGDTILGMRLDHGGHLTHGAKVSFSGTLFHAVAYGVNPQTELIDMDEVRALAKAHRPKMIVAGASSYSRVIDWKGFADIAKEVGAYLMADMAHYAGLVAGGTYPTPVGAADFVTSTTHKTLRGPRGGFILAQEAHEKKINSTIFPGTQGGPLMHAIAAKAVAFAEASTPEFKVYAQKVVDNARAMAEVFEAQGFRVVAGGTDCHMFLVDLRPKEITGKEAEAWLEAAGITLNKNAIPFDPQKPMVTSGIRVGTPAITTRGLGVEESREVARLAVLVLENCGKNAADVLKAVQDICARHPVYGAFLR